MRFVMVGGFLGAGKTTTLLRLARHYAGLGLRVGIVTNDQATDLVDTHTFRESGFDAEEVPGSCFCCNFHALTDRVESLDKNLAPDIVLAEPVGSCTDLVATVVRPIVQVYDKPVEVAPYAVLLKPTHGLKILRDEPNAGFSPKAAYIFLKQLEEADLIVVNRIDRLSLPEQDELVGLLNSRFPGTPVVRTSAKTGEGFPALIEFLDRKGSFGAKRMEVDYDVYAAGEAELGWLNAACEIASETPLDLDAFLLRLVADLGAALPAGAETAHLKAIGLADGLHAVANLTTSFTPAELSLPCEGTALKAQVIVNARVALDPVELERLVRAGIAATATACGAVAVVGQVQSFRPGRPVPTYRVEAPAAV